MECELKQTEEEAFRSDPIHLGGPLTVATGCRGMVENFASFDNINENLGARDK